MRQLVARSRASWRTGVDFTWIEDLDLWPDVPQDDDVISSRSWHEFLHGAMAPLFWTVRGAWFKGVRAGLGSEPPATVPTNVPMPKAEPIMP